MKNWKGHQDKPPEVLGSPQRSVELPKALYPAVSRCRDALEDLRTARASPLLFGTVTRLSGMTPWARLTANCVSAIRELSNGEKNEFALSDDELLAVREVDELRSAGRVSVETEGTLIGLLCPEERANLVETMLPAFRRARTRNNQGE